MKYLGRRVFRENEPPRVGILLVNLGTPSAPTKSALRSYLKELLSDPRVVEAPRLLWQLILRCFILTTRPKASAALYGKIWRDGGGGAPLFFWTKIQAEKLRAELARNSKSTFVLEFAMRYGEPSIRSVLVSMLERNVEKLLFLPLYPQYSAACSASSFDALSRVFQSLRSIPELRTVMYYYDHPLYIEALKRSVLEHWEKNGRAEKLLLSFHGIPKRYSEAGDPYHHHCKKTARLLAEALLLDSESYAVAFHSRFGKEEWLKPYTDETLLAWAKAGVSSVDVICPGFAADCLETLEEIGEQNRELFLGAGGSEFAYIPALNDRDDFIQALAAICLENLGGWVDFAAK